ncbi:MAG: hypothetical protein JO015_19655 [Verrucomicrobia bacterium]|nr:hypothetical protein [Verrucomicrobiota bacterium]
MAVRTVLFALATFCGLLAVARADFFNFDPTSTGHVTYPSWVPRRPVATAREHAELSFPIQPVPNDYDLVLTAVFQEELGAFLSVYWQDRDGNRQLLCSNLFENINLLNQRTLLISRAIMGGPGKVILQSSHRVLNVLRVRLEWARPGVVRLVDSVPNGALIATGEKFYAAEEVDGSPLTAVADNWEGATLTTSVTDQAERVEQGVVFPVGIDAKVRRARVEVLVNGLPLDGSIRLWVNRQLAGILSVEVPNLNDPGYSPDGTFVGWRKAVLLLPPGLLIVGENTFQFEGPTDQPLAIRDFLLQLAYAPN